MAPIDRTDFQERDVPDETQNIWPPSRLASSGSVESSESIDTRVLLRRCRATGGVSGSIDMGGLSGRVGYSIDFNACVIDIVHRTFGRRFPQQIRIESTRQNFGGRRWWARCPRCHRRVLILRRPAWAIFFLCRRCYELRYLSEMLSRSERGELRTRRIKIRLGGTATGPFPSRPRRMRHRTYARLRQRAGIPEQP